MGTFCSITLLGHLKISNPLNLGVNLKLWSSGVQKVSQSFNLDIDCLRYDRKTEHNWNHNLQNAQKICKSVY